MNHIYTGNMLNKVTKGVILQQVNAQGAMGSGIALSIREKWPVVWDEYSKEIKPYPAYADSLRRLGRLIMVQVGPELWVGNIVGQQFYGSQDGARYTSYDAVDMALTELNEWLRGRPVEPPYEIHYPLLGSDRGGAHWPTVKSILNHRLKAYKHHLWLLPGVTEPT
jgi:O-acetyl-ADP-ribose deacetylase (regulator of RNase III)